MQRERAKVLLSWSSGKDCAWVLHVLQRRPDLEVVGLLTTFNEMFDRVAMHAVRRELVELQAAASGLPVIPVMLPTPCTNEIYVDRMKTAIAEAKAAGVTHIASATSSSKTCDSTGSGSSKGRASSRYSRSGARRTTRPNWRGGCWRAAWRRS